MTNARGVGHRVPCLLAAIGILLTAGISWRARAQDAAWGRDGLGGGRDVGSARVDAPVLRGSATLGFAHTEEVLDADDRHERLFAEFGLGWIARPWLQLSVRYDNRYDLHRSDAGRDSGFAGSPVFSSRHAFELPRGFSLAGQARLRFPSASTVARSFRSATSELAALVSRTLMERGEITLQVGYRFDRTRHAFVDELSRADALAASMSRWNAVLLGALLAVPVGRVTVIGEWSWEPYTGASAPGLREAPSRLRAAVQARFGERLLPGIELGVNLSSRPEFEPSTRIEPRMWAAVSLGVILDRKAKPRAAEQEISVEAPEPQQLGKLGLSVLGPDGSPLGGATIAWQSADDLGKVQTDAEGKAEIERPLGASLRVTVSAEGMLPAERTLVISAAEQAESVRLERALPEGEIKGKVRSLRGGPLKARVEVQPTGQTVETELDGTFQIAVPPGEYRLLITAPGHERQERPAQVERQGVTILVVDLRKAQK